jgi:site-specific recombinase XerD
MQTQATTTLALSDLFEMFLSDSLVHLSLFTIEIYRDCLFTFEETLERSPTAADLTADNIALLMREVKHKYASRKSRQACLAAMQALTAFALRHRMIEREQAESILSSRFSRAVA